MVIFEIISFSIICTWLITVTFQRKNLKYTGKIFNYGGSFIAFVSLLYILNGAFFVDYTQKTYYQSTQVDKIIKTYECEKVTYEEKENYFFLTIFSGKLMEKSFEPTKIENCKIKIWGSS